jgi:putative polyhydroxyalkanoate system protein
MPKFTIERSHNLGVEVAKQRLDAMSERLSAKYGLSSQWKNANEAEVKGTGATGKITCTPDKVSVFIDLSFALTPLKSKIEEKVKQELERALSA